MVKKAWIPSLKYIFYLHTLPHLFFLILWKNIHVIHARDAFAGRIASFGTRYFKRKTLLDLRGMFPEEAALRGIIKPDSVQFRKHKNYEKKTFQKVNLITCVSKPLKKHVENIESGRAVIEVPIVVDIEKFKKDAKQRYDLRKRHNIKDSKVLVYSGSIGTWTDSKQIIDLFHRFYILNHNVFLLILTFSDTKEMEQRLKFYKIPDNDYLILNLKPEEVSRYLNIADCAVLLRKESIVNYIALTTKFCEYLAMGLPVIANPAVANITNLIKKYDIGLTVTDNDLDENSQEINKWLQNDLERQSYKCIKFARQYLSTTKVAEQYLKLYNQLIDFDSSRI